MANKRFIATVTFYSYGETEQEAFENAQKLIDQMNQKEDNQSEIEQFHFHDFGMKNTIKLDIEKLKNPGN